MLSFSVNVSLKRNRSYKFISAGCGLYNECRDSMTHTLVLLGSCNLKLKSGAFGLDFAGLLSYCTLAFFSLGEGGGGGRFWLSVELELVGILLYLLSSQHDLSTTSENNCLPP